MENIPHVGRHWAGVVCDCPMCSHVCPKAKHISEASIWNSLFIFVMFAHAITPCLCLSFCVGGVRILVSIMLLRRLGAVVHHFHCDVCYHAFMGTLAVVACECHTSCHRLLSRKSTFMRAGNRVFVCKVCLHGNLTVTDFVCDFHM